MSGKKKGFFNNYKLKMSADGRQLIVIGQDASGTFLIGINKALLLKVLNGQQVQDSSVNSK